MKLRYTSIIKSTVAVLIATVFFACKNNFEEVQKIGISENEPIGVADTFNLKYTDSGKLRANLISDKMLDFSNREFDFFEFPDGAHLDIFDAEAQRSTVVADYAIVYNKTNLVDMQGNVVLTTPTNDTLFAEQLYYDQKKEWVFTNQPVTFRQQGTLINGKGFDSDQDFKNAQVLEVDGYITVDE